jgi:hypothetical protein
MRPGPPPPGPRTDGDGRAGGGRDRPWIRRRERAAPAAARRRARAPRGAAAPHGVRSPRRGSAAGPRSDRTPAHQSRTPAGVAEPRASASGRVCRRLPVSRAAMASERWPISSATAGRGAHGRPTEVGAAAGRGRPTAPAARAARAAAPWSRRARAGETDTGAAHPCSPWCGRRLGSAGPMSVRRPRSRAHSARREPAHGGEFVALAEARGEQRVGKPVHIGIPDSLRRRAPDVEGP